MRSRKVPLWIDGDDAGGAVGEVFKNKNKSQTFRATTTNSCHDEKPPNPEKHIIPVLIDTASCCAPLSVYISPSSAVWPVVLLILCRASVHVRLLKYAGDSHSFIKHQLLLCSSLSHRLADTECDVLPRHTLSLVRCTVCVCVYIKTDVCL